MPSDRPVPPLPEGAKAGQRLAVKWGHTPWSDSWADLVAGTVLDASPPERLLAHAFSRKELEALDLDLESGRLPPPLVSAGDKVRAALRLLEEDG